MQGAMHVCLDARESDFLKDCYKKEDRLKEVWEKKFDDAYSKTDEKERRKAKAMQDMREKLETDHKKSVMIWEAKYKLLQSNIGEAEGIRETLESHRRQVRELERLLTEKENNISTLAEELKDTKRRLHASAIPETKGRSPRVRAPSHYSESNYSERPPTVQSVESFRSSVYSGSVRSVSTGRTRTDGSRTPRSPRKSATPRGRPRSKDGDVMSINGDRAKVSARLPPTPRREKKSEGEVLAA
eukprot:GFYU01006014.1.p1 GENE.GFYU01006014.1~~GFYU01006014.1.p1  ORF type:complete len:243 (-),score=49.45 GFYU01006014.1:493-1221(-)